MAAWLQKEQRPSTGIPYACNKIYLAPDSHSEHRRPIIRDAKICLIRSRHGLYPYGDMNNRLRTNAQGVSVSILCARNTNSCTSA
jgi:hypothetical protein